MSATANFINYSRAYRYLEHNSGQVVTLRSRRNFDSGKWKRNNQIVETFGLAHFKYRTFYLKSYGSDSELDILSTRVLSIVKANAANAKARAKLHLRICSRRTLLTTTQSHMAFLSTLKV